MPTFEQIVHVYGRQGKLVHSSKCANIVVKENLSSPTHEQTTQNLSRKSCGEKRTREQVKLPRNLSRKTWPCEQGFTHTQTIIRVNEN